VASDVGATSQPSKIGKRVLAVLHPGAMGAAVAACLVDRGHEVGWLHTGRSEATSRRAAQAGLTPFGDLAELLARSDIVFSICPPHGALVMARELAGFQGIVVDANAISPETSALIRRTVIAGAAGRIGAEDDVRGLDQDDCGIAGFDPTYRRRLRGGRRPGKRMGD
jgi:lactate dehydrogenase-like 2-hydroxyacid dehydrogenase